MSGPREALEEYRRKRDFGATPEPSGDKAPGSADEGPRFVVQEHHATALHWDLRLERDGVLPSWAVPKGIPADPRVNHLAVRTEDHPMEYLDFAGDIPEGSYGAGSMRIWDRGTYEEEKFSEQEVKVVLHGERIDGRYVLFRTGGRNGRDWMIHRMSPAADPGRELLPVGLLPMWPTPADRLPDDAGAFASEVWWDGVRVVVSVEGGRVAAVDGAGEDVTGRFPEFRALGLALGATAVVLDGVLVAFGDGGRPDRERIERRLATPAGPKARRMAEAVPAVLIVVDLLWLEGHPTTGLPYGERRRFLEGLELAGPSWQVPSAHADAGADLLTAVREQGLRGVIAKRLDSLYRPGETSADWLAVSVER